MNTFPLTEFVARVVTSEERVQFSQIDPYGHLNASRYSEFIINHRITAVEDQLKVSTLDILKELNVAFVVSRLDLRYLLPSYLGETLEIASWVESINQSGFQLRVLISGVKNKKVRASALMEIRTVDAKTAKPVSCPEVLPTRAESNLLELRPVSQTYCATLVGVPRMD